MKQSSRIHKLAASAVFLVWVSTLIAMVVNWEFWSRALPFVLLCSGAAMAGTIRLSRYWIRHKSAPSYGTIFTVPLICAFLLIFGLLFCDACISDGWQVFTAGYWQHTKGGFSELVFAFCIFWFVSLFPTTAVVIYFQKPRDPE